MVVVVVVVLLAVVPVETLLMVMLVEAADGQLKHAQRHRGCTVNSRVLKCLNALKGINTLPAICGGREVDGEPPGPAFGCPATATASSGKQASSPAGVGTAGVGSEPDSMIRCRCDFNCGYRAIGPTRTCGLCSPVSCTSRRKGESSPILKAEWSAL